MQFGDGLCPCLGGAERFCAIGPELIPARANKHDCFIELDLVASLPRLEIGGAHQVIRLSATFLGNVYHRSGADKSRERNLVRRMAFLEEMNRRVDVSATMLGGAETICAIEPAPLGHTERPALEVKGDFGRPVDVLLVEGVRQIDDVHITAERTVDELFDAVGTLSAAKYAPMRHHQAGEADTNCEAQTIPDDFIFHSPCRAATETSRIAPDISSCSFGPRKVYATRDTRRYAEVVA